MRSLTLLPAALLLLAACSTPQERAANMQAEMEQMITIYGPACARLGYTPNSDQWRACVLQLSTKDDMQRYGSYPYFYGYGGPYWHSAGMWGPAW